MKKPLIVILGLGALSLAPVLVAQEEQHPGGLVGTTAALAKENQMLRHEVEALLKANADRLGVIIDWVRLDPKSPPPRGYTICDGSKIGRRPTSWTGS